LVAAAESAQDRGGRDRRGGSAVIIGRPGQKLDDALAVLSRPGDAWPITAATITFLLSLVSSWTTGAILDIAGGATAGRN
jgi:hypothetical protein